MIITILNVILVSAPFIYLPAVTTLGLLSRVVISFSVFAYNNVNSSGVKRVGGLPVMCIGIFENAYLATSITAFQAAVLNYINVNSFTKTKQL